MTEPIQYTPKFCVWELTLACNAHCVHCGSNAGKKRAQELTTSESLNLIEQLSAAGVKAITFSGGEPLLRSDWRTLAKRATDKKIRIELITNGLLAEKMADDIADAGFYGVTFSVDGTPSTHDQLRGVPGCFDRLIKGAKALQQRGIKVGAATQVNRQNQRDIAAMHQIICETGFDGWQIQLTMPRGMAAHNDGALCLSPEELPLVAARILDIKKASPLFIQTADNFGYMGRHEPQLRSGRPSQQQFFTGCQAGLQVVGITSNGTIRGCLSQSDYFNEGNIRDNSFNRIWTSKTAFLYNRQFKPALLTGPCATCSFKYICRAGCKSLSHATANTLTENHHCLRQQEAVPTQTQPL